MSEPNGDEPDDEIITCWCGAKGTYDELFEEPDEGCGGTGYVYCYCGGDQCVCHHHGQEIECPGCPECPASSWGDGIEIDDDGYAYNPHGDDEEPTP